MSAYMMPIKTAVIMFVLLVFIIFIPWLILHYRKYRYFSLWTAIVTFSFIFYSIAALFLVLLPLPQTRDTCALQSPDTVHYILRPFNFLDGLKELNLNWKSPRSYLSLIREPAFLEPVFNAILLFPLGVYLRYFFQKRGAWLKTLLIAFSVSLFFEITQLTGIYGIYNCAYRLFDVDDLMFNTLGAVVGFFLAPILLALFPSRKDVLLKSEKFKLQVTPMTQILAVIIDLFAIKILSIIIPFLIQTDSNFEFLIESSLYFIVFALLPVLWKGQTVGSAILRFNYQSITGSPATWRHFIKRFIAIYSVLFIMAIGRYITAIDIDMYSPYYPYEVLIQVGFLIIILLMWFILMIHIIYVLFKKGKRAYYFDHASKVQASRRE